MTPSRLVRVLAFLALCLPLAAVGCSGPKAGAYLFTVAELPSGKVLEGATVSVEPGQMRGRPTVSPVSGTTDDRGQVVLPLGAWPRAEMTVSFDGENERFFVAPERIPSIQEPEDAIRDARPFRFVRSTQPNDPQRYEVRAVRIRDGLEPPKR